MFAVVESSTFRSRGSIVADRILITGASGLLGASVGQSLARSGSRVLGTRRSHTRSLPFTEVRIDLTDSAGLRRIFADFHPNVVVHCAALSRVLECENDQFGATRQNVEVTDSLLLLARQHECYFIFISTDQVFDGRKGMFVETDMPAPTHHYGRTKLAAEVLVGEYKPHLIVRSNNIVGQNTGWGSSFTDGLLERLRAGETLDLFADQYRSPIHLREITSTIVEAVETRLTGILHAGGPERLSRYETGLYLARAYGFPAERIHASSMDTHPARQTLHHDGSFNTNKLKQLFPKHGNLTVSDGFAQDAREHS